MITHHYLFGTTKNPFGTSYQGIYSPAVRTLHAMGMKDKLSFFLLFDKCLLHGMSVICLGLIYSFRPKMEKFRYYYVAFWASMAFISIIAPNGAERYAYNIFPLYILLCSFIFIQGIKDLTAIFGSRFREHLRKLELKTRLGIGLAILLAAAFLWVRMFDHQMGFKSSYPNLKKAHNYLTENIKPNDILISANFLITSIYLRQPDYFLRQKKLENGQWGTFKFEEKQWGVEILDRIEPLARIIHKI